METQKTIASDSLINQLPEVICWEQLCLPIDKCYEIEQRLANVQEKLPPLKSKLKRLCSKYFFYESIIRGSEVGYEMIIPSKVEIDQETKKYYTNTKLKSEYKDMNIEVIKDIESMINKILLVKKEIEETLRSPGDNPDIEELENKSKTMISEIEIRIEELEDYQNKIFQLTGLKIDIVSERSVRFSIFNLIRKQQEPSFQLDVFWSENKILTDAKISPYLPIEDIIQVGIEDNNLHFIVREVLRRVSCITQRKEYLDELRKNDIIFVEERGEIITVHIVIPNKRDQVFSIELLAPWDVAALVRICALNYKEGSKWKEMEQFAKELQKKMDLKRFVNCVNTYVQQNCSESGADAN